MKNEINNASKKPFNIDFIIEALASYPERDYAEVSRIASKLIDRDTVDSTYLGADLTKTDIKQMLGRLPRNKYDVIDLIGRQGSNSPEYDFAVERRIGQTINKIVRGVKKKHDEADRAIINDCLTANKLPNFNTWKNNRIFEAEHSLAVRRQAHILSPVDEDYEDLIPDPELEYLDEDDEFEIPF